MGQATNSLEVKRREANPITYDGRCTNILHTKFKKAATSLTIWLAEVQFSLPTF